MKPQLHKLPLTQENSFFYRNLECAYFDKPWHFHQEYELVLIEKSRGTKFIGNNVSFFKEGDLYLLGPNIPHLFKNNEDYYQNKQDLIARSTFLHFDKEFLGSHFLKMPEMKLVNELLINSNYCLEVLGKSRKKVIEKLIEMKEQSAPKRLLNFLEILIELSESDKVMKLLSKPYVHQGHTPSRDRKRIHTILEYIMENYHSPIYISELASKFNMCDASFSRYFKHHTRKTFSKYVTEIRISHACQLLLRGDESISQVGYICGFQNLSNFYRHFKKTTGTIPKEYRKKFMKAAMD